MQSSLHDDGGMKPAQGVPMPLSLEHVSPATRLLEKLRQTQEVQHALDTQKHEYTRKEEQFRRREENLRKKDLELQEALVQFNKFLKENEAKRRRAHRRAQEQIQERKEKEITISKLEKELQSLQERRAKLKYDVSKNERYETFLKEVQRDNTEYQETEAIVARYTSLVKARNELKKQQREVTRKHEDRRQQFINYNKAIYNQNLAKNNDIARLSKDLEQMLKASVSHEEERDIMQAAQSARTLKVKQIITAVDNLHERCKNAQTNINHHKTLEALSPSDNQGNVGKKSKSSGPKSTKEQINALGRETKMKLEIIGSYLVDIADIVEKYGGYPAADAPGL